jgi:imidazolonepropionase-like amidohydrolase
LLRLATESTPRVLFPERLIGRFAEGAEASLIALDANPLVDLSAIRRVSLRVKQGNLLAATD